MKGKATISRGLRDEVFEAFRSDAFARAFIVEIIEDVFGVKDARFRPAEFYNQTPDEIGQAEPDFYGLTFTISGVTRKDNREPKVFHSALRLTLRLCTKALQAVLAEGEAVQVFCNMMLSGDVPLPPEIGGYSNVHDADAVWVTRDTVSREMPANLKAIMEERLAAEKAGRPRPRM